ncbi:hypothetical protein [Peribacillus acanthi]|uniref:hypothetical protein n=1 Tax=Peribacillus acanthi TaxID=2171554 RepID=UPI000D3E2F6F|nr:hypothetical protein [Peribacillus acanthi]
MSFWDTAGKIARGTAKVLQDASEQAERRAREQIRTFSDERVLRAMNNADEQWARNIAYEEARRRGLV